MYIGWYLLSAGERFKLGGVNTQRERLPSPKESKEFVREGRVGGRGGLGPWGVCVWEGVGVGGGLQFSLIIDLPSVNKR